VGVEHELCVWAGDDQVDFRHVLPRVVEGLRALDPGDPRARRLPSGVMLTADGREAELATPPVRWGGVAPATIDALLAAERSVLARRVAEEAGAERITGFSTHVNVGVPDDRVVDIGHALTRYAGLATAVVAEPASSSGLLVRPRRGRLEVGGEYAEGAHLVAWVTFLGSAIAALLADTAPPDVPPPVTVASREKFGWYLPVEGAYAALLGDPREARALLGEVWAWARPWCLQGGVDTGPVAGLVAGAPLRSEDRTTPAGLCTTGQRDVPSLPRPDTGPRRLADGTEAETTWLTWSHVVWTFSSDHRQVHAVLPVGEEAAFLAHLDRGELDDAVRAELRRRVGRRRLLVHADVGRRRWWHTVRPGALVPAERGPDGAVPLVSRRRAARELRGPGG
jgi:hypothetical protein